MLSIYVDQHCMEDASNLQYNLCRQQDNLLNFYIKLIQLTYFDVVVRLLRKK